MFMTDRRRVLTLLFTVLLVATLSACGSEEGSNGEGLVPGNVALAVAADVVWGPLNIPDDRAAGQVCVNESRFPRSSEIVWRVRVTDPITGQELDDSSTTAQIRLGDGQVLEMRYGPHPRENSTDFFWTTSFDIPQDYPTGTLSWEVTATSGERSGVYTPFNVAPSLLTITDEVLPTIEEG